VTPSAAVRAAVGAHAGRIAAASPVSGGCINRAYRLETAGGPAFLKTNAHAPRGFFAAEARGLDALRPAAGDSLRIPRVLALEDTGDAGVDGEAWLLLEWLEPGPGGPAHDERLGRGVAALHAWRPPPSDDAASGVPPWDDAAPAAPSGDVTAAAPRSASRGEEADAWGAGADNFIGALPQENAPAPSWPAFWRDRRLEPQLRRARDAGRLPGRIAEWDALLARLPATLASGDEEGPSMLHGDLWSGNAMSTADGIPALVDPAAYRGHREADLAMAELFGGFGARFHAAHAEAAPLRPGYAEARRPVYQLYYLLVHVNLFGGGYVAQTADALRRALAG
jgi:fructosamine-3-kinase